MTVDQECNFALVEFGDNDKTGYAFVQGGDAECMDRTLARTYWYPDNLTQEEIRCEIRDLMVFYKNVAIMLPLPESMEDKLHEVLYGT